MKSNERTELTRKMGTDSQRESRRTASEGGGLGIEGLIKKENRLIGMDNSVVIAGGRAYQGTKR